MYNRWGGEGRGGEGRGGEGREFSDLIHKWFFLTDES